MTHWYCSVCKSEKVALTLEQYDRLRLLFEGLNRKQRPKDPSVLWYQSLLNEFHNLTGEAESSWVHIIVHSLRQPVLGEQYHARGRVPK